MYAPTAIQDVFRAVDAELPGLELAGITGDTAHTYGYHLARNLLPSDDYSVVLPLDQLGDSDAASALDTSGDSGQVRLITARLNAAMRAQDPLVRSVREFYGPSADGSQVIGWDAPSNSFASSDDSHLWHLHISFYRKYATDTAELANVAAVLLGRTDSQPHQPEEEHSMAGLTQEEANMIGEAVATSLVRRALGGAGFNGNIGDLLVAVHRNVAKLVDTLTKK